MHKHDGFIQLDLNHHLKHEPCAGLRGQLYGSERSGSQGCTSLKLPRITPEGSSVSTSDFKSNEDEKDDGGEEEIDG